MKVRSSHTSNAIRRHEGAMTVAQIANEVPRDQLLGAICQFMDDFACADDQYALIADEPHWAPNSGRWPYDFAAAAHKMASDHHVKMPAWILKDDYISPTPCYAFDTVNPRFQEYLEETTPAEYRYHNLYLGENTGTRA